MGWLQIILLILKYGPAVFELLSELWELIKRIRNERGKGVEATIRADLNEALRHYKLTRDRGPLRRLRDRLRKELNFD